MLNCKFKPRQYDDPKSADPVQAEFFAENELSKSLINEGVQNTLDSKSKGSDKVFIRIFLSGDKYAIKPKNYLPLINEIRSHLESPSSGILDMPDFKAPMRFMVFEDFYTTGLEGDPILAGLDLKKMNPKEKYNFYFYWRNTGRSGKMEMDLGRWGLGKTAFSATSRINTNFGLTVREGDGRRLLMGETTLRTHFEGKEGSVKYGYNPYGMWGKYSEGSYFCEPVEDEAYCNDFEKTTMMTRGKKPGLSNFLPFVRDQINAHNLMYATIEQYFLPIIKGELEMEIREEDCTFTLNSETIFDMVERLDYGLIQAYEESNIKPKEILKKNCEMAIWSLGLKDSDYYALSAISLSLKPKWASEMFSDEAALNRARNAFENGERVAIKVPVKYHPIGSCAETRWFDVFLEKDLELKRPEQTFIRGNLTISGVRSFLKGPVRAMAIIQDPKISKMLGDAENPSHNSWSPNSRNFQSKYTHGEQTLSFIQNSIGKIFEKLQKPVEGIQKDLLLDFFSISKEKVKEKTKGNAPKKNTPGIDRNDNEDLMDIVPNSRFINCHPYFNGIRLKKNRHATKLPDSAVLELAYDVAKGKPMSSYEKSDFDVSKSPIEIEAKGIRVIDKSGNKIVFEIRDREDFELTVIGFDKKRDLFYKITESQTENDQ